MKMLLTAVLIAGVSSAAFAGETASKAKHHTDKAVAKSQSSESKFPKSVHSQVFLGGLNDKHKEYLLRQRQAWDLYN